MVIYFFRFLLLTFAYYLTTKGNFIFDELCVIRQQPIGVWNNCEENEIPVGK